MNGDLSTAIDADTEPLEIDRSVAHAARMYNYLAVRHEAPFDRAG